MKYFGNKIIHYIPITWSTRGKISTIFRLHEVLGGNYMIHYIPITWSSWGKTIIHEVPGGKNYPQYSDYMKHLGEKIIHYIPITWSTCGKIVHYIPLHEVLVGKNYPPYSDYMKYYGEKLSTLCQLHEVLGEKKNYPLYSDYMKY